MQPPYLIGIDLGTSSTKTIIIDSNGCFLGRAAQEYTIDTPRFGWAEQDPKIWVQAALTTLKQAVDEAEIPVEEIAAIGLSGQMHGTVCLDKGGNPLRPAIIWADQRSRKEVEQVYNIIGREQLGIWTANPLAAGFMLATWMWLHNHEPETYRRTAHLLLPKDYLRFVLTGEIGAEPSDASSTLMFDTANRKWQQKLLAALNISSAPLPPCSPSTDIAGTLKPEIAQATGLHPNIPVVFGGSDQSCQAVGNGIIEPGMVSCTIGTGGQLFVTTHSPTNDPQLRMNIFCHALPDRWHLLAATLSAGLSLKWLRDQIITGKSYQELVDMAAKVPHTSERLFFLPYLAGERTPHMDSEAPAAFIGLTLRHTQAHLVRATLEGVVYSLRQGLELISELKIPIERIIATGGASAHPIWLQLQTDIFNHPIYTSKTKEAAATGAALLAGVGAGVYENISQACLKTIHWHDESIQPNAENAARYDRAYQLFTQLYPSLKTAYDSH